MNLPDDVNRHDRPIDPEYGRKMADAAAYALCAHLWPLAWGLATDVVRTTMNLRKAAYGPYRWFRDPFQHHARYNTDGPGQDGPSGPGLGQDHPDPIRG